MAMILACMAAGRVGQGQQETSLYREGFEADAARDWDLQSGWEIAKDREGGKLLHGVGHSWARLAHKQWSDYRLRLKLYLVRGAIHVNFRVSGIRRYFIRFEAGGTSLSRQNSEHEFLGDLAQDNRGCAPERWYTVEISGQGEKLVVSVDGAQRLEYRDADPLRTGGIAFETLDDSEAYIDDVTVLAIAGNGREQSSPVEGLAGGRIGERAPSPPGGPPTVGQGGAGAMAPLVPSYGWIRTGGPLGGLGYDIRMRPDNPDIMFVTDSLAGPFKSIDGGQTWFPSNGPRGGAAIDARSGPTGDLIPVFSLTIDPNNPDVVWVGTQHRRGIFKSQDGGRSWIRMDQGVQEDEGISFRGFTVDPKDSNTVYAAAELSSGAWAGQNVQGVEFDMVRGVVYKTTDGGAHWQRIWYGNNLARYVFVDPRNSNVVYMSTGIFDREAANSDPQTQKPGGVGVLKSTDGGKTWHAANTGLGNLYVGSLAMHLRSPEVLLAGAGHVRYREGSGVYLSEDGGATWQQTLSSDQGPITSVEFVAGNLNLAYAGTPNTVYRSDDRGRTWRPMTPGGVSWGPPGIVGGFPIDFQADPRNGDRLFANAYGGGAFLSTDGGATWRDASRGYTGAIIKRLAIDPRNPQRVFVGGRSGLFVTNNRGGDWEGLQYPDALSGDWNALAVDPSDSQHVVAGNNWGPGPIHETRDGGKSWTKVFDLGTDRSMGWRSIVFAPSKPKRVYAGSGAFASASNFENTQPAKGIYASDDGGTSWLEANNDLSRDAHVAMLAVDPGAPMLVYAATTNHGILKTFDGGKVWQATNGGLPPGSRVLSVAICPNANGILLCGLEQGAVYRSVDAGQTWTALATGLDPNANVVDLVFDCRDSQIAYAADLFSGVYRLHPGSQVWKQINEGLLVRAVYTLACAPDGSALYAGTDGNGVYRRDLGRLGPPEELPEPKVGPPFEKVPPGEAPEGPMPKKFWINLEIVEQLPGGGFRPVPGAHVEVKLGDETVTGGQSDGRGAFRPESLRPERFYVVVTKEGYHPAEADTTITHGDVSRRIVLHRQAMAPEGDEPSPTPPPEPPPQPPPNPPPGEPGPPGPAAGTLQVNVIGPGGHPVRGAVVVVRWAGQPQQQRPTDFHGNAVFRLRRDNYEILVPEGRGYAEHREGVSLTQGDAQRQIVLRREGGRPPESPPESPPGPKPTPEVTLTVTVQGMIPRIGGRPVPGAQVAVLDLHGRQIGGGQTDGQGRCVVNVRPGHYRVRVSALGAYAPSETFVRVGPAGGQTSITLQPAGRRIR